MSVHKYLTHGGLPPEVLEDTYINKIICDGLTDNLRNCMTRKTSPHRSQKREAYNVS